MVSVSTSAITTQIDMCSTGLTYAMWLWFALSQAVTDTTILSAGGVRTDPNRVGVRYFANSCFSHIRIISGLVWKSNIPLVESRVWFHLFFIWRQQNPIRSYVNGCSADHDIFEIPRTSAENKEHNFTIGRCPDLPGNPKTIATRIDELRIWHQRFESNQVWTFYVKI